MGQALEKQLLDALELFQYSYKFRDALFILVCGPDVSFEEMLTDIKLLQASHISVMLVAEDGSGLQGMLEKLSLRGLPFDCNSFCVGEMLGEDAVSEARKQAANGVIPAWLFPRETESQKFHRSALSIAASVDADKVFILSRLGGVEVDGAFHSHLCLSEIQSLLSGDQAMNISRAMLGLLSESSRDIGCEIVLLEGSTGSLFREIFTHRGKGTLITDEYPNVVRRGVLADVFDISRLLRPAISSGTILRTTEDEIADNIDKYFVYTVNGALVAAAQLEDFGAGAALSKFCTLPRYQGKGRARELAREMVEEARVQDKPYVFALSTEVRMWAFFRNLGFTEVPRESLPAAWAENYDFSRPSRAFRKDLT